MNAYDEIARDIDQYIAEHLKEACDLSDWIWTHPELGLEEHKASEALSNALRKTGFQVEHPYAGYPTAFNAEYINQSDSPTVCYLAQYDALPEIGHGCGHNMCGAISVLAAGALRSVMEKRHIRGRVRVVGTPAEETTGEKVPMTEAGLFNGCDLVTMAHAETGKTFIDFESLAVDPFDFTFTGAAAHAAASPWDGRNALNGLQLFFHAIDMLRQHIRPEARIHGIVTEGGTAPNIVPARATARVLIRAPWRTQLNSITEKVLDCARGAALATQTEVTWRTAGNQMDNLLRNKTAESMLQEIMEDEIGEPTNNAPALSGSTDMGAISWRCPTTELMISISDTFIAPHTVEFADASRGTKAWIALEKAARGIARAGLRTLLDEDLRQRMKEDIVRAKQEAL